MFENVGPANAWVANVGFDVPEFAELLEPALTPLDFAGTPMLDTAAFFNPEPEGIALKRPLVLEPESESAELPKPDDPEGLPKTDPTDAEPPKTDRPGTPPNTDPPEELPKPEPDGLPETRPGGPPPNGGTDEPGAAPPESGPPSSSASASPLGGAAALDWRERGQESSELFHLSKRGSIGFQTSLFRKGLSICGGATIAGDLAPIGKIAQFLPAAGLGGAFGSVWQ